VLPEEVINSIMLITLLRSHTRTVCYLQAVARPLLFIRNERDKVRHMYPHCFVPTVPKTGRALASGRCTGGGADDNDLLVDADRGAAAPWPLAGTLQPWLLEVALDPVSERDVDRVVEKQ
jgi:hypothetical protein